MLCVLTGMWLHAGRIVRRPAACAALVCIVFGIVIECVQSLVPYRSFEAFDILINCSAVLLAAVLLHFVFRRVRIVTGPGNSDAAQAYQPAADQQARAIAPVKMI
jgi:VanZ family protein